MSFETVIYPEPPGSLAAPLPYHDLLTLTDGHTARTWGDGVAALLATDHCFIGFPIGIPMRMWINGAGGNVDVASPDAYATGDKVEIFISTQANNAAALAATHLRYGIRGAWEQPAPFPANAIPVIDPHRRLHGRDPAEQLRRDVVAQYVKRFAQAAQAAYPYGPLLVNGVILSAGPTGRASDAEHAIDRYFIYDAYLTATNRWLGVSELITLHLPVLPTITLPTDDPSAFQTAFLAARSVLFPRRVVPCAGVLLRPTAPNDRRRYFLAREQVADIFSHPPTIT